MKECIGFDRCKSRGKKILDAKMEAERVKLGRRKILSRSGEVLCEGGV